MHKKEFVAFKGKEFIVEWYFDAKGKSTSLDYFEYLDDKKQIKLLELFELIGNFGEIKNKIKFNNEGDKIYAFKPQPHRFLCFFLRVRKL